MSADELTPDELEAWIRRVDLGLTDVKTALDDISTVLNDAAVNGTPAPIAQWQYKRVEDWVGVWFAPTFARQTVGGSDVVERGEVRWCSRWYDHPEAICVLDGLWRKWETLRQDKAGGMAAWFIAFAYPLTDRLFSDSGTFRACTARGHHMVPPMLPVGIRDAS